MKRRDFGKVIASGLIGTSLAGKNSFAHLTENIKSPPLPVKKNLLMRVGGDNHTVKPPADGTTIENLEFKLRHGVRHITAKVTKFGPDGAWDFDELKRMKSNCDTVGVELECVNLGTTLEKGLDKQLAPHITLGKSPERERELDVILNNIRMAGKVGIGAIRYHWRTLPIFRNLEIIGRGGSIAAGWKIEKNWRDLPLTAAGRVSEEESWERVQWFLDRVIPVAEEYKVRMACHPPDVPLPLGYRGLDMWNHDIFAGLRKYADLKDSPYHGFLLCVGTIAEGLDNPGRDVYEIIEYLGRRKQIFCVHLRNIKGGRGNFVESYPDDGDVDFYRVLEILRDTQYPYSILPDHMPSHPDDPKKWQAFAFGYGYIKGMIQAVNSV